MGYEDRNWMLSGDWVLRGAGHWVPCEHVRIWGYSVAVPAACRCDRSLHEPHTEPTCPYVSPELWYAAEVARMAERAPA